MKSRIVWWVLTVACACTIVTLSLQPASQSSQISAPIADWVIEHDTTIQQLPSAEQTEAKMNKHNSVRDTAHICVYTVFVTCVGMLGYTYNRKRWYAISTPVCVVFAVLDESLQHFFASGRIFQMSDVWRNWLGVAIGSAVVTVVTLLYARHKTKQEAANYGVSGTGAG